jgi:predicted permease
VNEIGLHVSETVTAFALLVAGAYFLKRQGLLKQEDAGLFSRLLTQALLPATILYQLWTHRPGPGSVAPILAMFLGGAASLVLSWSAGRLLKFDRARVGALMIVSSFGSSSLIGYPIIQFAFSGDSAALAEGIVISELGVGLPIYIFCPAVAMAFGGSFQGARDFRRLAREYFLSPTFLSILLGLALSQVELPPDTPLVATITETLSMVQGSLVVVSAIILGLQLDFQPLTGFWKLIAVSAAIQMVFQPWFVARLAGALGVSGEHEQVLVLISLMPAAILGPVFAERYNCASKVAALLAFTHILISPILVPAVFALLS